MTAEQRVEILDIAKDIISVDRNSSYGAPEDNFGAISGLWGVYINNKFKVSIDLTRHDVAVLMSLMKIGRIATGAPGVKDNYVDEVGYMAIAWEQYLLEKKNEPVGIVDPDDNIAEIKGARRKGN